MNTILRNCCITAKLIKIMDRRKLTFENYEESSYNAEWDCWNVHGVNVYQDGHWIGEIAWKTEEEVADMTDEELEETLAENGILL